MEDWRFFTTEERLWIESKDSTTRTKVAASKRPVTIVLPGVLGSRIDVEHGERSRVGWLDLKHVPGGRLGTLRLGTGQPKGWAFPAPLLFNESKEQRWLRNHIIYSNYYPTLVALRAAGHDTWLYPFDWRQPIADLGSSLAKWIGSRFEGRKVNIVAHSMGGLVAKTALHQGTIKCVPGKLISAGSPWLGAASPLAVMRQLHEFAITLERCDLTKDGFELADVFATFPGLLGMLPRYAENWSDLENWPSGNHPAATMRQAIGKARLHFPAIAAALPAGWKHHAIVGDGVRAITGIRSVGNEFVFDIGRGADGTVPHRSGRPEGLGWFGKTWYVHSTATTRGGLFGGKEELAEHGKLLKRTIVADAVISLLNNDTCSLKETRSASDVPEFTRTETRLRDQSGKLRTARAATRSGPADPAEITSTENDIMRLVSETLLNESPDEAIPDSLHERMNQALAPGAPMIFSRRRDIAFEIELAFGDITETTSPVIVLAQFQGMPTSTAAIYLDEAMGGELMKWLERRKSAHGAGELDIIPTGRHYVMAEMIAFLGLGMWTSFNRDVFRTSVEGGVRSLLAYHIPEFSTVIKTGPIPGGTSLTTEDTLSDILSGLVAALRADSAAKHFRRIVIVEHNAARFLEIKDTLPAILSGPQFQGITASVLTSALPSRTRIATEGTRSASERAQEASHAAQLHLRLKPKDQISNTATADKAPTKAFEFTASLRRGTSGVAADLVEVVNDKVTSAQIDEIHRIVGVGTDGGIAKANDLVHATKKINIILTEDILASLGQVTGPLRILHDAEPTRIPWEAIADSSKPWETSYGGEGKTPWEQCPYPALRGGINRMFIGKSERFLPSQSPGERLRILMVIDPTNDLPGARIESEALRDILLKSGLADIEYLEGEDASKERLGKALESRYNILHYAGHSAFNPSSPEQAGLLLHGDEFFNASDILGLPHFPPVVVLNSCESARVRRRDTATSVRGVGEPLPEYSLSAAMKPVETDNRQKTIIRNRTQGLLSIAEGFLLSGINHFLGTFWPVGDAAAKDFSSCLYKSLAEGKTIGNSIIAARRQLFNDRRADWANYIHYGNPDAIIFEKPSTP